MHARFRHDSRHNFIVDCCSLAENMVGTWHDLGLSKRQSSCWSRVVVKGCLLWRSSKRMVPSTSLDTPWYLAETQSAFIAVLPQTSGVLSIRFLPLCQHSCEDGFNSSESFLHTQNTVCRIIGIRRALLPASSSIKTSIGRYTPDYYFLFEPKRASIPARWNSSQPSNTSLPEQFFRRQ